MRLESLARMYEMKKNQKDKKETENEEILTASVKEDG